MGEEARIVALREIGALVRTARFFTPERRVENRFGNIEHEREFQRGDALGVERSARILDRDPGVSVLQPPQLLHTFLERGTRSGAVTGV